jgi:hypothetical protein
MILQNSDEAGAELNPSEPFTFLQPERFSWPLSFPHTSNEVHPFGLSMSITWPSGHCSVGPTRPTQIVCSQTLT